MFADLSEFFRTYLTEIVNEIIIFKLFMSNRYGVINDNDK